MAALQEALDKYPHPEIFNTDRGSTFTARCCIDLLLKHHISISMDSRGDVCRTKLYYLRGHSGKSARIKEKLVHREVNVAGSF